MAKGLSTKLPLSFDDEGGYTLNKTYTEVASQNLKCLLLTNPGERVMEPGFGIGIKTYLFEQNIEVTYDLLRAEIYDQVGRYLPYIEIDDVNVGRDMQDDSVMIVRVFYTITPLAIQTSLELFVTPNKDFI